MSYSSSLQYISVFSEVSPTELSETYHLQRVHRLQPKFFKISEDCYICHFVLWEWDCIFVLLLQVRMAASL